MFALGLFPCEPILDRCHTIELSYSLLISPSRHQIQILGQALCLRSLEPMFMIGVTIRVLNPSVNPMAQDWSSLIRTLHLSHHFTNYDHAMATHDGSNEGVGPYPNLP